jgi:hypothetical protein
MKMSLSTAGVFCLILITNICNHRLVSDTQAAIWENGINIKSLQTFKFSEQPNYQVCLLDQQRHFRQLTMQGDGQPESYNIELQNAWITLINTSDQLPFSDSAEFEQDNLYLVINLNYSTLPFIPSTYDQTLFGPVNYQFLHRKLADGISSAPVVNNQNYQQFFHSSSSSNNKSSPNYENEKIMWIPVGWVGITLILLSFFIVLFKIIKNSFFIH